MRPAARSVLRDAGCGAAAGTHRRGLRPRPAARHGNSVRLWFGLWNASRTGQFPHRVSRRPRRARGRSSPTSAHSRATTSSERADKWGDSRPCFPARRPACAYSVRFSQPHRHCHPRLDGLLGARAADADLRQRTARDRSSASRSRCRAPEAHPRPPTPAMGRDSDHLSVIPHGHRLIRTPRDWPAPDSGA